MLRGPVVPSEAHAWSTGKVRSSVYFAWARRRAWSMASQAVRSRLRRAVPNGRQAPEPPPNGG